MTRAQRQRPHWPAARLPPGLRRGGACAERRLRPRLIASGEGGGSTPNRTIVGADRGNGFVELDVLDGYNHEPWVQ